MSSHNGHACLNCRQRNLTECQPDCKFRSIPMQGAVVDHHPVEAFATGSTSAAETSSSDLHPQAQTVSGAVAAAQPKSGDPAPDVPDEPKPICSESDKDKLVKMLDDAAPIATPVGTPIQEPAAAPPQSGGLEADVPDAAPAASPVGSPVVPQSAEGSPVEAFGIGSSSVAGGSSSDLHPQVQSASAAVAAAQPKSGDPAADVPDEPIYYELNKEKLLKMLDDATPIATPIGTPIQETVAASLQSGDLPADVPVAAPAASPFGSSSVVPESAASGVAGPSSSAAKNVLAESPEYNDDIKELVWSYEIGWTYVDRSDVTVAGGGNNPGAAVVDANSSDWSGGPGWTDVSGSSFGGGGGGNGGGDGNGGGGGGNGNGGGGSGGAPAESQSSS